mmetsp:Transcript_43812/g.101296  ORF Transcript_43812/g.101296 Transcript_43812/m.101296 type:complete len:93 (+) Transcript_43812:44-322(+)
MLQHVFEGRLRGKYNLTEPSAWKALERDAQLHAEALSSITSAVIETEKRPAGVENASRFDPESVTFEQRDAFDAYRAVPKLSKAMHGDAGHD